MKNIIKSRLRILSLLLLSFISQLSLSVNIYVQAPTAPYIFAWSDTEYAEWPGLLMTQKVVVDGVQYYYMSFSTSSINVIFNNGEAQTGQTGDFMNVSGNAFFNYNGGILAYGLIPETATANAIGEYVFFVNTGYWSKVNAVINGHSYPMTMVGIDGAGFQVYKWEATSLSFTPSSITFNNGSGQWVENSEGEVCTHSYVRGGYYLYAFFLDYSIARLDMPTVIRYVEPDYSVSIYPTNLELKRGSSYKLSITVSSSDGTIPSVEWKSSNTNVATVASNGLVYAKSVGEADITATVGEASATCHVKVIPVLAESISLNESFIQMRPSEIFTLVATVLPNNADNRQVNWIIPNNSSILSFTDGNECMIVAHDIGTVDITACTTDGTNLSATCRVQVGVPVVLAESISLDHSTMKVEIGDIKKLTATVLPANTTNKKVSWKSSSANVEVIGDGYIKGVKTGTAIITATTTDGSNLSASCRVTVISNSSGILLGDVDDNGVVNIDDVVVLIDYLLSGYVTPFNMVNADLDADSKITINDMTLLIDLLLR